MYFIKSVIGGICSKKPTTENYHSKPKAARINSCNQLDNYNAMSLGLNSAFSSNGLNLE